MDTSIVAKNWSNVASLHLVSQWISIFSRRKQIDRIVANEEGNRYFLMSRVNSQTQMNFVRSAGPNARLTKEEINSELGIFGSLISVDGSIRSERLGGSLLRSKPAKNIEGGIASGQGYIDSVLLVEVE